MASQERLRGQKYVSFAGRHFNALIYIGALQCEYIVCGNVGMTLFDEFVTAVAKQNVLAATIVIDTVDS